MGLVYCDFKPDNVMLEKDDVKLIDMGGVRRIDDMKGDIYGTIGYSAPEAGEGPTPVSDLYTVGRSLAVLLTEIHGFASEHRYTLPGPQEEPRFAQQESLYRCLLKSTAQNPDDRFESAEEMTEQLLGVLREVVAVESATVRPGISLYFGGDILALESGNQMEPVKPDYRYLPMTSMDGFRSRIPERQQCQHAARCQKKRAAALTMAVEYSTIRVLSHARRACGWPTPWRESGQVVREAEEDPGRRWRTRIPGTGACFGFWGGCELAAGDARGSARSNSIRCIS